MTDYFTVFGLPRKLAVDAPALQRRFYELSREHHPDFHHGADAVRQAEALAASALVNRAYRALRDPLARVEYLIALEEARAEGLGGDAGTRLREERARLEARYAAEADATVERAGEWDRLVDAGGDRKPLLEWFKQRLATRAYLRTVIDDLSDALGEREESHVSHRR